MAYIAPDKDAKSLCIFVQNKPPMLEEFSQKNVSRNMDFSNEITKSISFSKHKDILKMDRIDSKLQNIATVTCESRDKKLGVFDENVIKLKVNNNNEESLNVRKPTTKIKTDKKRKRKRNPMTYKMCSKCPVQYKFIGRLKEHMKTKHNIDLFVCKVLDFYL